MNKELARSTQTVRDSGKQSDREPAARHSAVAQAGGSSDVSVHDYLVSAQSITLMELTQEQFDSIALTVPGGAANVQDIYPLSSLQEGMLFHRLMNEGIDTYVLSTSFELHSRARLDALINALNQVVERHDVLRTAFLWEDLPKPTQVVYRRARLPVEERVLDGVRNPLEQLSLHMRPGPQPIDLRRAPLGRLLICAVPGQERCYAVLQLHHLVCDHQSLRTVVTEAITYLNDEAKALPPAIPYRNYVAHMQSQARPELTEGFFRAKLAGITEPTAPFELTDVHRGGAGMAACSVALEPATEHRIRTQAIAAGVSVARMFHAAWALVIAHTTGRDDVVFGTVMLTAPRQGDHGPRMLGMTINTLPLRLSLQTLDVRQLLEHTSRELTELRDYRHASLALTQRGSEISGKAPLFTTLLNFRHGAATVTAAEASATGVKVLDRGEAGSNYPISVTVDDMGEGFVIFAQADERIGPSRIIDYMRSALLTLVGALERGTRQPVLTLEILPEEERQLTIEKFNATHLPNPDGELVHKMFERWAECTPRAVALTCGDRALTFAQLNRRANQLARALRTFGVRPDGRVALYLERSVDVVTAMLGTLKAGGAYVPLDTTYPLERIAHVLSDSGPLVVLTMKHLRQCIPETDAKIIALDDIKVDIDNYSDANLDNSEVGLTDRNMAYVIYTSGSTGSPKGVVVEHHSLVNLIHWHCSTFDLRRGDCGSSTAALGFDAATWEIWPPLSVGARLALAPASVAGDTEKLLAWWGKERIDVSFLATPIAELMLGGDVRNPTLRSLLVGGDRLRHHPSGELCELINNYGPTEATVVATSGRLDDDEAILHIGRPIRNTQIYILDRYAKPVPVGVAGEMYVGGLGIARGYLRRPDMTAEKFVPDPFSANPGARMYRTGDIGRWRADGVIEYLGRNDHQVKVRGIRIELGEIEATLLKHERVQAAAVIAGDVGQDKRLAAYVVPESASSLSPGELRAHLKAALPDAMIPSVFVMLDRMPLTPHGKLDRRGLPAPDWSALVGREFEAPRGQIETTLADIWQRLLRVAPVSRADNFFELGGHSLLIVQMMDHLRRLGLTAEVREVFESATLAELAATIVQRTVEQSEVPLNLIPSGCDQITPQMLTLVDLQQEHIDRIARSVPGGAPNIQDIYPLAPLQEGILFHHRLNEQAPDVYVLPTLLRIASRERIDALVVALQQVIDRHDVLRTAILWERLPRPLQVVYRQATLQVEEVELDPHQDSLAQVKEWIIPEHQQLDLHRAPLLKLRIAAAGDGRWYALLLAHHIADDATSLELIIGEVVAHLRGLAHELSEAVPYRNHVARSLAYAGSSVAQSFFREKLQDVDQPTAPFGLLDVHESGGDIVENRSHLESAWAKRIRAQARNLSVSAATIFHAAWALVAAHTTGQDDVVFGSVLLGRMQGNAGGQQTLGMLINTLPVRLRLSGLTSRALVVQAQKELIDLMAHEQASLAVAQRCSGISGSTPLFTSLLNYRHVSGPPGTLWSAAGGIELLGSYGLTNYPITLSVDDFGEDFSLVAQTDQSVEPHRVTEYLRVALQSLVIALEQAHDRPALELSILPDAERRLLIFELNGEQAPYASDPLIHHLFEEQAARRPESPAVLHEEIHITYAELNGKANQLARYLRSRGVGRGQLVGICVERSLDMVISLLGILKAGGAYVPIDPNYPAERLQYMLEDAAPGILLTQRKLLAQLPEMQGEIVPLDERFTDLNAYAQSNLSADECDGNASDLVYVIYTSGSTGHPKGTAMSHRAMVNLVRWHSRTQGERESRRVLQFAALSFDVAFQEIFSTLCVGGALVLLDEWVRRDASALTRLLQKQAVEGLFVPPMTLQSLAEHFSATGEVASHLREITSAGEQLRIGPEIIALFKQLKDCRLHNHYGPTETHVVTALNLHANPEGWPTLPSIGRPIDNTQIYILGKRCQLTPRGVVGEIYIGGANVASGYLHRPELTAERFIPDPFSSAPSARLYRTGDLGRWRTDGTIEYLGRNDEQVKIRGFRIELGEIEVHLARHPQVSDAAVMAREDVPGERVLVAYVVWRGTSGPTADELRSYVKAALPEHMVPSAFVSMDALPLTPSGKLNRRALPAPEARAYANQTYESPRGDIEEAIAKIWRELLHLDQIGRHDNFFDLGGHSLLATRVVARIQSSLSTEVPVRLLFECPTLQQLGEHIEAIHRARLIEKIAEGGAEVQELLERLRSMPESKAEEYLNGIVGRQS